LYPTNFRGSDVIIFGVKPLPDSATDRRERVFRGYFLSGAGWLRSFSYGLPEQDDKATSPIKKYEGTYSGGDATGPVALSFGVTPEGNAVDAWLNFGTPRGFLYLPFQGTYSCAQSQCQLRGNILSDVPELSEHPFFRKGDRITIDGSEEQADGKLESV